MRKTLRILLYSPVFLLPLIACNKEKLEAPTASYIKIDTADVHITSNQQGSANNKITDIWLYVDQQFKGAYPLGNIIPVVSNGSTDILIYPGIKNNGISATRMPYAFLQGINVNLNLKAGQTTRLRPQFEYRPSTNFHQVDGFEGGTCFINSTLATCTSTLVNNDPTNACEGSGYLSMSTNMTDANNFAKVITSTTYTLPLYGAAVYAELNYKTNQTIEVGVFNTSEDRPAITLNATSGWNKIYIQLTSVVSTPPLYPAYGVYIKALKQTANPEIYIDNFKLISE